MTETNQNTLDAPKSGFTKFAEGWNRTIPTVSLIVVIGGSLLTYAFTQNSSSAISAQTLKTHADEINELKNTDKSLKDYLEQRRQKRDSDIDEIKKTMLPRDLYEAYHKADQEKLDRIEKLLENVIANPQR